MKDSIEFEIIDIPNPKESDYSSRWQDQPIEDLQISVWKNKEISNEKYFVMDIWSSAWAAWTWTATKINLIWNNWDLEKTYSQEIIQWAWSTTAKITKKYTIDTPINNSVYLYPWKVFELNSYMNYSTQTLTLSFTWTYRYLRWSSLLITSTNPSVTFINSGTTVIKIDFKYSTSAWDRPIFWFYFKIF